MELWRQCAAWLIECRVLPDNHRVTWENAQVRRLHTCGHTAFRSGLLRLTLCVWCQVCDLAQALRDGVLLCQLLNNLLPQAVNLREINLRPQMSQVTHLRMEKQFPICFHSDQEAMIMS